MTEIEYRDHVAAGWLVRAVFRGFDDAEEIASERPAS